MRSILFDVSLKYRVSVTDSVRKKTKEDIYRISVKQMEIMYFVEKIRHFI